MDVVALTHQGATCPVNEDTIAVDGWVRSAPMCHPARHRLLLDRPRLLLVADGMGTAGGAIASRAAAEALVRLARRADHPGAVVTMVETAHSALLELMREQPALRGMGTTVAGLVLTPERGVVFNVGDSRVHGVQQGTIEQLSTDDTPGPKGPDGRSAMIRSSLVTQVVGGGKQPVSLRPHILDRPLRSGTTYLVSSDGLTDLVGPEAIVRAIDDHPADAVVRLFKLAMEAGGTDNISLLLAQLTDADPIETRKRAVKTGYRQVRHDISSLRQSTRLEIVKVRRDVAELHRTMHAELAETRTAITRLDPSFREAPRAWRAEVRSAEDRLRAVVRTAQRATLRWIAVSFALHILIMAGLLATLFWLLTVAGSETWLWSILGGSGSNLVLRG